MMAIFRNSTKALKALKSFYKHLKRAPKKAKSSVITSKTYNALKLRANSLFERFKTTETESPQHKILSERERKGHYWYLDSTSSEWIEKKASSKERSVTFDDDAVDYDHVPITGTIFALKTANEFAVPKTQYFMNVPATPVFFAPEKIKYVTPERPTYEPASHAHVAASFFGMTLKPVNKDRKANGAPNKPLPPLPTKK